MASWSPEIKFNSSGIFPCWPRRVGEIRPTVMISIFYLATPTSEVQKLLGSLANAVSSSITSASLASRYATWTISTPG